MDDRKRSFPVIVNVARTLGSCRRTSSAWFWSARIWSGDDPSRPIMTPQMKLLSPGGRKALGTAAKRPTVPSRQTTQISAETQRCRRNHQSDLP